MSSLESILAESEAGGEIDSGCCFTNATLLIDDSENLTHGISDYLEGLGQESGLTLCRTWEYVENFFSANLGWSVSGLFMGT